MAQDAYVCRGAIFDLDGTLADSMGVWEEIDRAFLQKRGICLSPEYTEKVKTMGFADAARYTAEHFGLPESPERIIEEWNRMALWEYGENIPLKPGAKAYLKRLKGMGVPIALATASAPPLYEALLKNHGVYDCFDAFVSPMDGVRDKRYPDIYLLAARRLGVAPEECVVFEDILAGVRGAKAAGMRVCGVCDPYSAAERPLIAALTDCYIESFEELLASSENPPPFVFPNGGA